MKKKTKNRVKYKKEYIVDGEGSKYAPFEVVVSYDGYDSDLDYKLISLADRNSGEEEGSGYGFGSRDISFGFFTVKGVKTFVKKATDRYADKFDLDITVYRAEVEVEYVDTDPDDL